MNARRSIETGAALLLIGAVGYGSAPSGAEAAANPNPDQNRANLAAKGWVKRLGGRMLRISRQAEGDQGASSIKGADGTVTITIIADSGDSLVAGSNGKYRFTAFADHIGNNGLDRGDINSVDVREGKDPSDDQPLTSIRLFTPHPHGPHTDGPLPGWFYAEGTTLLDSGQRVGFGGTTDPSPYDGPPSLKLNRAEVSATGRVMDHIITEGLRGEPTRAQDPPFGPVQPEG